MNAIAFDTHAFVKRPAAAGTPEGQAEVLADEQTKLIEGNLVTKFDLERVEVALKSDIELVTRGLTFRLEEIFEAFADATPHP